MNVLLQEAATKIEQSQKRDILIICRVFFPDAGGIQEYVYNRCMQDPTQIVVLTSSCTGDRAFDQMQSFPVYRWWMPAICSLGAFGSIIKQILNIFWSVTLGIKLYQKYRYSYIEWWHGYDFPALLLLSYLLPVECVIYLHGDDVLCPLKNPIFHFLFQWTLQRTKVIVCNSKFTQSYVKSNWKLNRHIEIIHPTIRAEKFGDLSLNSLEDLRQQIRDKYQIPKDGIVILSVGRLVKRKGFDRIIHNLPHLIAAGLNVYYLICGRGPMESELNELANRLDVNSRVILTGYISDADLAGYYSACDIFSMLTFYDSNSRSIEGFGIVYLEAGYFSKPVIASRVGGVEDAVFHGETGLLVDPNSSEEILSVLHQLCVDKELRQRLGFRGKELVNRTIFHRIIYMNKVTHKIINN
ncbi:MULTISPECIES: glycosyltransferase family 4 protein [unclassified Tolypothrix]|uniref:glycosyltransferase family 4 protein n=1 Tax=unclassified Tolypothrix TaxID=2649714 RepID=UPI0005EABDCF|nr:MULTISPECIES: glycosyltransferase family 4 protein [unclassified Tolypothrix]BAY93087.1 group 1 glycosyl transferase [Microchaete diplosiphon NIES-3275]EKF00334.1 glycosyltransferase, group 1 family [Tolypothrix sp. PCC 7601]MBE9081892.1 glycosyltransferase family 4 protein [Tolypothrix sp. LEGE 11397]UYD26966.1 glycosyltransferase family 4 protein [Tolypothrix sp. PCC 7712]UYD37175.1 glycosyltransferase family 4 protein [Tolypothrix sp. PCC 7601]